MKCLQNKNRCKICFQTCNKKNGIQCHGACKKWAHFKCLNYTLGKIQDIKAGTIQVTCPCPDCNKLEPKETVADPVIDCTNTKSPINPGPIGESRECLSKENLVPTYPPPPFEYSPKSSKLNLSCVPQHCNSSPKCLPPENPLPTCPSPKRPLDSNHCTKHSQTDRSPETSSTPPSGNEEMTRPRSASPHSPDTERRPSNSIPICSLTCPSYQLMKNTETECTAKQSQSCSDFLNNLNSSGKRGTENVREIFSDSKIPNSDQKMLLSTLKDLYNTVDQLTSQLKGLMCKMQKIRND